MKKLALIILASAMTVSFAACSADYKNSSFDPSDEAALINQVIAQISGATVENEKKIDDAYLAYWSLPEEYRASVTNYEKLTGLRSELTKQYIVKPYRDTRIPHERLLIGCYRVPECTDAVLSALAECHFDLIWDCVDTEMLERYGLGMIPSAYALEIPALDGEEEFLENLRNMNLDSDAIWCVDLQDEPRLIDMAYLHEIGKLLKKEALPSSGVLSNLLPAYAFSDSRTAYEKYVKEYFDTIGADSDFVCVDHYVYNANGHISGGVTELASFLNNLETLAGYCRDGSHDLNVILQHIDVTENNSFTVSDKQLKFQAYASLAYGAKGIHWYAMHRYEFCVVDSEGNKTGLFDRLEDVNRDLKALEPVYMRYTGDGTAVLINNCRFPSVQLKKYIGSFDVDGLNQTALSGLQVADGCAAIVGHFRKNAGEGEAFLFVGCNNYRFVKNQTVTVTFGTSDPDAIVTAYCKGIPKRIAPTDGVYTVEIQNADAVFVTVG